MSLTIVPSQSYVLSPQLKRITLQNWTYANITKFLDNPALSTLTELSLFRPEANDFLFRSSAAVLVEERQLIEMIRRITTLVVLEIIQSSSFTGQYASALSIRSFVVVGCRNIKHLSLPPTVKHLDAAECIRLESVAPCKELELLRFERGEPSAYGHKDPFPRTAFLGFHGTVYTYSDLIRGDLGTIRSLLHKGANVHAFRLTTVDGNHDFPDSQWKNKIVHEAALEPERLSLFLNYGADINAANCKGWTPSHIAAFYCHVATVALLVKQGADRHAKDCMGKTALNLLEENIHTSDLNRQQCITLLTMEPKL